VGGRVVGAHGAHACFLVVGLAGGVLAALPVRGDAGVVVSLLDCGEFGRQGAAQHDDLAKIVAARLVPFEPLQASCFAVPRAAQFLQPLVEWARLGIVRGFEGGEYADVRGSEIGAVAGEYVDPLLTRLRHVGCDEMGDVAGTSGAPSQLALERSRDVLNGGELVGGERLDEELADGP
jgi:hypothetical protein